MAIHVGIEHMTSYRYDRPVAHGPHVVRLRPAPHTRTRIHDYHLTIGAEAHRVYWQEDPFGNLVARVVFPKPLRELTVAVDLVAEMTIINPFDFFVEAYAEQYPFRYDSLLARELEPYFELVERSPRLMAWLQEGVTNDPEQSRPYFQRLRELAEEHGLQELSMGTSQDYEVAVEEGATIIRIGSVLYQG